MIGKLTGIVDTIFNDHIILDVAGVGYLVYITNKVVEVLQKESAQISLYISVQIRENDISLFGFLKQDEKDSFMKLISVKGIGPKLALCILSSLSVDQIHNGIIVQDATIFSQVSGVGKKTAERIINELKDSSFSNDQLVTTRLSDNSYTNKVNDCVSALVNLGYNKNAVFEIANRLVEHHQDASEAKLIKLALKELST